MKQSSLKWHPFVLAGLLCSAVVCGAADKWGWQITKLPIRNALHPSINNSGEIVWALNMNGGIFSSTRGQLPGAGLNPHLSNSGEVVYAGGFEGPTWDLVSTTRGRLTYGSVIDVNLSDFDVNAAGEVVYVSRDSNHVAQVYSTVRNQITFDPYDHYQPCINDQGEIVWNELRPGWGSAVVSTTRGLLSERYGRLLDMNNLAQFCYADGLEFPAGQFTYPHIFSSAHGVLINDPVQYQWDGSINDAGVIVWTAPETPGSLDWYVFKAEWVRRDGTPPQVLSVTATPNTLWPVNHRLAPVVLTVEAGDNSDPAPVSRIVRVTSSDPVQPSTPDWGITGPLTLNLRAERSGKFTARTYTVLIECTDSDGNASRASVTVTVPHDSRK